MVQAAIDAGSQREGIAAQTGQHQRTTRDMKRCFVAWQPATNEAAVAVNSAPVS
jgi:hypothetical protein